MGDQFAVASRPTKSSESLRPQARGPLNEHRQNQNQQRTRRLRVIAQPRLLVGPADDPFEREAEHTAHAVLGGTPASEHSPSGLGRAVLRFAQRAIGKAEPPTKKDDDDKPKQAQKFPTGTAGPDIVPAGIESGITAMSGGGQSLPSRTLFESRFGFDFSDVRIHSGPESAGAASALGARAFTVGNHIYFGAGELQPSTPAGRHLIAHELTHTIQQKAPAARTARLLRTPLRVQRFPGIPDSLSERVRDFVVKDFPPWDLITLIIGRDPIRDVAVKGGFREWLHAAMKIVPNGEAMFEKLDQEGKIEAVQKWWDAQISKLDLTLASITDLVKRGWDAVSGFDVLDPVKAWNEKIKPIFQPTLTRVFDFIKAVGTKVFEVVKDIVLKQVGEWAKSQKGYPLLTMVLGRDPVTGEAVTPTLKGVIFAVLDLVDGGDKIKENLEKSKTIEKAANWFKAEVKTLDLTWDGIKLLFSQAWDAFKVVDLLNPKGLLDKMWGIFGPPVTRLINFLIAVGKKVLEFIFEGAMLLAGPIGLRIVGIFRKIGSTFQTIINDPIAFVGHLVDGVKKGIGQFAKNIWEHLKTGVIGWLTGALGDAGLVLPKVWDLKGILDLVLQILGITYPKVRVKLVKVLGEKTVSLLETAFAFLKTLVTEGPAAAWQQIVAAIGSLWDLVIGGIKDWAVTKIVTAAITKLVTMLNPAGAVIQAIIATYNTIAFFIERINQILDFVDAVVDSIANLAEGKIAQAANWIEKAMAKSIPVLLGFLARLVGLGDVSAQVKKVIAGIQAKVDKGIDKAIDWIVAKAKQLFGGKEGQKPPPQTIAKHEALLKDLVARVEEDEPGLPLNDADWLKSKRDKADKLARDAQPQLAPGVKITTAVAPGSQSRQFSYDFRIAPNTTIASGTSSTPPILTKGEKYICYQDLGGNTREVVGTFVEAAVLGGKWVLKLNPEGERETERKVKPDGSLSGKYKALIIVPAEKASGGPNFRLLKAASAEPPQFQCVSSRNNFGGLQPIHVLANPLAMVLPGTTPQEDPPGWKRIHESFRGKWVRGHLVNGQMGGPGTNENLVPISSQTNAKMRDNHEKPLRLELQKNKYFNFHARVDYYAGGSQAGIDRVEQFVKNISVEYHEIVKTDTGWQPFGQTYTESYAERLPVLAELDTKQTRA